MASDHPDLPPALHARPVGCTTRTGGGGSVVVVKVVVVLKNWASTGADGVDRIYIYIYISVYTYVWAICCGLYRLL